MKTHVEDQDPVDQRWIVFLLNRPIHRIKPASSGHVRRINDLSHILYPADSYSMIKCRYIKGG